MSKRYAARVWRSPEAVGLLWFLRPFFGRGWRFW